jgi:hypothetical protein
MLATRKKGRARGGRNRGFFYRKGRGWCTSEGNRAVALTYPDGTKITDPRVDVELVKDALARYRLGCNEPASLDTALNSVSVAEVCQLYLEFCRVNNADSTYDIRAARLFDFVTGLPARFRKENRMRSAEAEKARIHPGYGAISVGTLKHVHLDQWLSKHPDWNGGKRIAIQAVLCAFNYCTKAGVIEKNPFKGYSVPKYNLRKTYLTPEQEDAIYKLAKPDLAIALKVCIRTGARPGCEFAKVTAKHVHLNGERMEWRFSKSESKTGKQTGRGRTIRITDLAVIQIVTDQIKKFPTGPIFRTSQGKAWTNTRLNTRFMYIVTRLTENGIRLDDDACMYSCRHTYAKRTLAGYWTGKPTNIETLAQLMGNSRQVCWQHYAEWCDTYTEPAWSAA